jgi:hypothetical protein
MRKGICIVVFMIIHLLTGFGQGDYKPSWGKPMKSDSISNHNQGQVEVEQFRFWITMMSDSLRKSKNDHFSNVESNTIEWTEYVKTSYRVYLAGEIKFGEKDTVQIVLHSSHENTAIGDIALAMNDLGDIYINTGHICGGMAHFVRYSTKIPESSEEFFTTFVSEADNSGWVRWKN